MVIPPIKFCLVLLVGLLVVNISGCSSKSVQSGSGAKASQEGMAGGPVSSGMEDGSLRGFDPITGGKGPREERVGGDRLMAKRDPDSAARQFEESRREEAASTAAGLRDVFFAYDSWSLTEEGRQMLSRDAEWIQAHPAMRIKIEGHCDERGSLAYNLVLGEKRAQTVRTYLTQLGVHANRLSVVSFGKERPTCKQERESCYAQNRRAHLIIRVR